MNPVEIQPRAPAIAPLANPVLQSVETVFAKILGDAHLAGVSAGAIATHRESIEVEALRPDYDRDSYEDRSPGARFIDERSVAGRNDDLLDDPAGDRGAGTGDPEADLPPDRAEDDGGPGAREETTDAASLDEDGATDGPTEDADDASAKDETKAAGSVDATVTAGLSQVAAAAASAGGLAAADPGQVKPAPDVAAPAVTATAAPAGQAALAAALGRTSQTQSPQKTVGTGKAAGETSEQTNAPATRGPGPRVAPIAGSRPSGEAQSQAQSQVQVTVSSSASIGSPNGTLKGAETIANLQDPTLAGGSGTTNPVLSKATQSAVPAILAGKQGQGQQGQGQAGGQNNGQQQLLSQTMLGARLQNAAAAAGTGSGTGPGAFGATLAGTTSSAADVARVDGSALTPSGQALAATAGQPRGLIQATAEASATARMQAAANSQDPATQIAFQVSKGARAGQERISMQLHPAELGRIDVKLEFTENGHLRVMVSAEKNDTLDLLQRDSRTLERALQDAGVKTDSNSLSFQKGQERNAGQQAQGKDGNAANDGKSDELDTAGADSGPAKSAKIHNGDLDIEV